MSVFYVKKSLKNINFFIKNIKKNIKKLIEITIYTLKTLKN